MASGPALLLGELSAQLTERLILVLYGIACFTLLAIHYKPIMAAGSPRASPYIVIYSANLFIFIYADAEVEAQFITDSTALLDFFAVFDVVDDGEDYVGNVLLAIDGEFEHGIIR